MGSVLRSRCNLVLPKRMHIVSMLKDRSGFKCTQMSASRLSSTNIAIWVGPLLPFAMPSLLMLSDTPYTPGVGAFFSVLR